jgi:hypothetical protein
MTALCARGMHIRGTEGSRTWAEFSIGARGHVAMNETMATTCGERLNSRYINFND